MTEGVAASSAIRWKLFRPNDRPWPVPRGLNIHAGRSSTRRGFIFMKILKRFEQRFAALTRTAADSAAKKLYSLERSSFGASSSRTSVLRLVLPPRNAFAI